MKHYELLEVGERLEAARSALVAAQSSAKTLHVSITDPIQRGVIDIDAALASLDGDIGKTARDDYRNRPRAAEPEHV
jgi:hypothetical protein